MGLQGKGYIADRYEGIERRRSFEIVMAVSIFPVQFVGEGVISTESLEPLKDYVGEGERNRADVGRDTQ